jgi:hypothetical protein
MIVNQIIKHIVYGENSQNSQDNNIWQQIEYQKLTLKRKRNGEIVLQIFQSWFTISWLTENIFWKRWLNEENY